MTRLDMVPDIDSSSLNVTVHGSKAAEGLTVQIDMYIPQNGTAVCTPCALPKEKVAQMERNLACSNCCEQCKLRLSTIDRNVVCSTCLEQSRLKVKHCMSPCLPS